MNRYWKYFLVLALLSISIQGVASISVGNIAITPSSDLISGQTQVRSTFTVNFPSSGGYTFDDANTLQFSSEMENPSWTYAIVLDGIDNPSKTEVGQNVNINGWILSYPSKRELSMKVTMEAVAPTVTASEEKVVIAVRELTAAGSKVSSSEVVKKKMVINPEQIKSSVSKAKENLAALREKIDHLAASGIDITSLEQKYGEANSAIQNAEKTSDVTKAQQSLNTANTAISAAELLASQFGVQKDINDIDVSMSQLNAMITDFKVNRSMSSDPRVTSLVLMYDDAADLVSEAKDLLSSGNYDEALVKAGEAKTRADQALAQATDLKTKLDANPFASVGESLGGAFSGGIVIIIVVAVLIVVAVVGVILFRRRRKWDELG